MIIVAYILSKLCGCNRKCCR